MKKRKRSDEQPVIDQRTALDMVSAWTADVSMGKNPVSLFSPIVSHPIDPDGDPDLSWVFSTSANTYELVVFKEDNDYYEMWLTVHGRVIFAGKTHGSSSAVLVEGMLTQDNLDSLYKHIVFNELVVLARLSDQTEAETIDK